MTTYADQAIVANAHIVLTEIQEYAARNPAFAKMLRNVKTPSGETIERFASGCNTNAETYNI